MVCTHGLNVGKKATTLYNEADSYVIFPKGNSPHSFKYFLELRTSMNLQTIEKVLNSNSRWTYINKKRPTSYVVEQHRLYFY